MIVLVESDWGGYVRLSLHPKTVLQAQAVQPVFPCVGVPKVGYMGTASCCGGSEWARSLLEITGVE